MSRIHNTGLTIYFLYVPPTTPLIQVRNLTPVVSNPIPLHDLSLFGARQYRTVHCTSFPCMLCPHVHTFTPAGQDMQVGTVVQVYTLPPPWSSFVYKHKTNNEYNANVIFCGFHSFSKPNIFFSSTGPCKAAQSVQNFINGNLL
jgi:hypothetical protein